MLIYINFIFDFLGLALDKVYFKNYFANVYQSDGSFFKAI
jgi:hypothetical protein